MLVGGFVFGLIVGSLADVVQKSDPGQSARVELLGKIHAYLHDNNVPGMLTRVIRTYFSNRYDMQSLFDERSMIFEPLPYKYRELLAKQLGYIGGGSTKGMLGKIPFFCDLDSWSQMKICFKLSRMIAQAPLAGLKLEHSLQQPQSDIDPKDNYLMREGQVATEMFIIMEGVISIERVNQTIYFRQPSLLMLHFSRFIGICLC